MVLRSLKKYEADLQIANARELEKFRADLQLAGFEYDTRFAYLHKRRGEVIDEVYKKIDKTMRLFGASARLGRFNFDSPPEAQQQEARNTFWELFEYYFQNRLYLDLDLCTQIEQFFSAVFAIETNLGTASSLALFLVAHDPNTMNQHAQFVEEARQHIINDLPPIRDLIETKMRTILGINHERNVSNR
ncbi:MAG: hypothetical protein HC875_40735 [Anaerolineales bacterium]|nr:hypothetical protein [Anaerolineales bacterium]